MEDNYKNEVMPSETTEEAASDTAAESISDASENTEDTSYEYHEETEQEKKERRYSELGYMIRGFAGGYVIYLAIQGIQQMGSENFSIPFLILAIALMAGGAFFIFLTIKHYVKEAIENKKKQAAEAEAEARGEMTARRAAEAARAAAEREAAERQKVDIRDRLRQLNAADGVEEDDVDWAAEGAAMKEAAEDASENEAETVVEEAFEKE